MLNGMTPVPYIRIVEVREGASLFPTAHSCLALPQAVFSRTVPAQCAIRALWLMNLMLPLMYTPFSRIHVHAASQAPVGMPANIALSTRIASVPLSGALTGTGQTGMDEAGLPNASHMVAPTMWLVRAPSLCSSQNLPTTSSKHPTSQHANLPPKTTMRVTRVSGRIKRRTSHSASISKKDIEAVIDKYDLKEAALELNVW